MQLLSVLWESGPLTVRELLKRTPDGKERAYTTVLSMMQGMERKGLVERQREGLTDRWRPAVRREKIMGSFLRDVVGHLFGGRPSAALQQLLASQPVDEEELAKIKGLIADYEAKQGDRKRER